MKATIVAQSLSELVQIGNYLGRKVDLQSEPLTFPMHVKINLSPPADITEEDANDAQREQHINGVDTRRVTMSFEEFETKYLKK